MCDPAGTYYVSVLTVFILPAPPYHMNDVWVELPPSFSLARNVGLLKLSSEQGFVGTQNRSRMDL